MRTGSGRRHVPIRWLLGTGALLCAASCDVKSDHCYFDLPSEPVTLTADQPEHSSRFLVESDEDNFTVRLTFRTETGTPPRIEARGLEPGTHVEYRSQYHRSDSELTWNGAATVDCGDAFPCVGKIEVVVTAQPGAPDVDGTLSGSVRRARCSMNPEREYLAVEPL